MRLHISKHEGKMEGFQSISVYPRCSCPLPCYAKRLLKYRKTLRDALKINSRLLKFDLPGDKIPRINAVYFRFNSFGELLNLTHLKNLCKIAEANERTTFTLWTKQYNLVEHAFSLYERPKNLLIIYSSKELNTPLNIKDYKQCDKVFTVWEKSVEPSDGFPCQKKCLECLMCYSRNKVKYINEEVK